MTTFDDFDAWGNAVSGASLRLACDAVDTGVWTLASADLGGIVVQVAAEGGGNLCYGANTHVGPILFVPLTHVAGHVVNGEPLDDDSLLFIPRGADFRICVRRWSHSWCSIALPADMQLAPGNTSGSARLACRPGAVSRLRRLVTDVVAALPDRPGGTAAHRAAGTAILDAVAGCLPADPGPAVRLGRTRLDRGEVVRRVMAHLESTATVPTAAELARDVGVTGRTLLRTFQETFGLPPKKYLMLRQLHGVRRILRTGAPKDSTVADVLTRSGIWEFGRFASRYRRQFGELPSETLRRGRA
jgi:AraC family ethanolamine operon transcriptional activator